MPIYMRIDGIKGSVNAEGHSAAGGASGGVWKTTNFLTTEPGIVSLSRISWANGLMAVDGREMLPTRKVEMLFETARMGAPNGRLYVATNIGVFSKADPMGRLLVGTDGGVWRSTHNTGALRNLNGNNTWAGAGRSPSGPGVYKTTSSGQTRNSPAARLQSMNNLKQMSLGAFNVPSVEIIVADARGAIGRAFRLRNVTISPADSDGTAMVSYTGLE